MLNFNSTKRTGTAAKLVLLIAKEMVQNKETPEKKDLIIYNNIDWEGFKDFVIYHQIIPYAYVSLKSCVSFLPERLLEFLKNCYYYNLIRHQSLWQEFLKIVDTCQKAGIGCIPIKGIALFEDVYAGQPVRPMCDIDLLIQEEDFRKIEDIFYNLGYQKYLGDLKEDYWKNLCQITFSKKNPDGFVVFIDLHWALDFKRKYRRVLPDIWKRIRKIDIDGQRLNLLSSEDTLFNLVLHLRRFRSVLYLKNVCDIGLLLNKYASNFDWDYILKESKESKICSTMFFALAQVKLLLDIDVPAFVWKGLNISYWKREMTLRFIKNNTFLHSSDSQIKNLCLKTHFLLYDSLRDPAEYILNIPIEQFASFNALEPYDKKTEFLYHLRLLYSLYTIIRIGLTKRPRRDAYNLS